MKFIPLTFLLVASLVLFVCLALISNVIKPLYAALGDTVGYEFRVNTETDRNQHEPRVAMDADGDFVVVWQSDNQDGSAGYGVYAQRYSADGNVAGGEFRVNTQTIGSQKLPSVAMDANGNFVVTWMSGHDGSGDGIYAQRYSADGNSVGDEFRVNTVIMHDQIRPSVAMDANGDFVIVWGSNIQDGDSYGVYAQRYNATGNKVGIEFLVNTETNGYQGHPSVAMDADGDFVVTWMSDTQDGSGLGVYAQRYNSNGIKAGDETRVNTETSGYQGLPKAAMDADGNFIVTWKSLQDGGDYGVYARLYSADGSASSDEFLVNSEIRLNQLNASVAMDADGDFMVAWESLFQDSDGLGIYAQRYSADGSKVGGEFRVNTEQTGNQTYPAVAMDADGDIVVIWSSVQDGDGYGVYAQRYEGSSETVDLKLTVTDDKDPVTTGNDFTYSLFTTNIGTGMAMNINLTETIPAGLIYVSDDGASSGWSCALVTDTLSCNLPFLISAASNTINVTVTADTAGTKNNIATVTAAQLDVSVVDNLDSETTFIDVDTDTDTVGDNIDNCPVDANILQTDSDADGVGDICDAFINDATETLDSDSDGVGNNSDNCPEDFNPAQSDLDADGFGDACDAKPNSDSASSDSASSDSGSLGWLNGLFLLPFSLRSIKRRSRNRLNIQE